MQTSLCRLLETPMDGADEDEAHLVGAAYEGRPTREKSLVFVFEGCEYLVPVTNTWDSGAVIQSVVRLDLAERVVSRARGSSRISEMTRTREISSEAKRAIIKGIHAWFLPEKGYFFHIVPFDAPPARASA